MRHTSLKSFLRLLKSAKLSETRKAILKALAENGPLTGQELARVMSHPGIWKRLSELKNMNLVVDDEVRQCAVTDRLALVWRISDDIDLLQAMPLKKKRRKFFVYIGEKSDAPLSVTDTKPEYVPPQLRVIEVQEIFSKADKKGGNRGFVF